MKGTITKILPMKYSRTESVYTRITFKMEDGSWAKTDIVEGYRNSVRWREIIESGVGSVVGGLEFKRKSEVNADSYPRLLTEVVEPLVEPLPENPQQKLF